MKFLKLASKFIDHHRLLVTFTFVVCVAVLVMMAAYLSGPRTQDDVLGGPTQFGQFGDYFGGVLNPIFGFLTVLLLIGTSQHSRKELELSRQEYMRRQAEDAFEALVERHVQLLKTPLRRSEFGCIGYVGEFTLETRLEWDKTREESIATRLGGSAASLHPSMVSLAIDLRANGALISNVAMDVLALTPTQSVQDFWHTRVMDVHVTLLKCGLSNEDDLIKLDTILRGVWGRDIKTFS